MVKEENGVRDTEAGGRKVSAPSPQVALLIPVQRPKPVVEADQTGLRDCGAEGRRLRPPGMLRMRPARAAGRALRAETLRRLPRRTGACWRGRAPRPGAELESLEGACETRGGSLGPSAPLGRPKDKASPLHQSPALPSVPVRLEDTSVPGFSWPSSPGTRTRRQPGRRAKRCDAGRWGLLGSRPSTQQPPEGRPRRTHEVKPPPPHPAPGPSRRRWV